MPFFLALLESNCIIFITVHHPWKIPNYSREAHDITLYYKFSILFLALQRCCSSLFCKRSTPQFGHLKPNISEKGNPNIPVTSNGNSALDNSQPEFTRHHCEPRKEGDTQEGNPGECEHRCEPQKGINIQSNAFKDITCRSCLNAN